MSDNPLSQPLRDATRIAYSEHHDAVNRIGKKFKKALLTILPQIRWPSTELVQRAYECFYRYCDEGRISDKVKGEQNSHSRLGHFIAIFRLIELNGELQVGINISDRESINDVVIMRNADIYHVSLSETHEHIFNTSGDSPCPDNDYTMRVDTLQPRINSAIEDFGFDQIEADIQAILQD